MDAALTIIPIDDAFFTCIIERDLAHENYYCGYIAIPLDFADRHDLDIDADRIESKIRMHGGCTYGPTLEPPSATDVILSQVIGPRVWVGYDCAHRSDLLQYGGTSKNKSWQVNHLQSILTELHRLENGERG